MKSNKKPTDLPHSILLPQIHRFWRRQMREEILHTCYRHNCSTDMRQPVRWTQRRLLPTFFFFFFDPSCHSLNRSVHTRTRNTGEKFSRTELPSWNILGQWSWRKRIFHLFYICSSGKRGAMDSSLKMVHILSLCLKHLPYEKGW